MLPKERGQNRLNVTPNGPEDFPQKVGQNSTYSPHRQILRPDFSCFGN